MKKPRSFLSSFSYAVEGIIYAIKHERNIKIHLAFALVVFILMNILELSPIERAILVLVISLVIGAEMLNTAIERLVDLVTEDFHPLAKVVKDVSAAAVLVCAMGAFIIGLLILARPTLELIKGIIGG